MVAARAALPGCLSYPVPMVPFTTSPEAEQQKVKCTMNIVVLQGTLAAEPVERTLPSGTTVMDWSVKTRHNGKSVSVPVQWTEPNRSVQGFDEGDDVVIFGSIRQRFFRAAGSLASRTEVVGEAVCKPTQRAATSKLLARAEAALLSPE